MCDEKDAKRYIALAKIQEKENNIEQAKKNYLEAASIYVLEAQVKQNPSFIKKANECYRRSLELNGKTLSKDLTKQELARITLFELNQEEKMCGKKSIKTLIELAKSLETKNPGQAADYYLEAAELLLKESYKDPSREGEYVEIANKSYIRAKELKKEGNKPENYFKQADIVITDKNKITFKDIGGLEELKDEIRFKIIEPFKKPDLFKFYGKNVGGGILMYGPPGCGKSLIAKATANEADATFIHVKSSDLKSKFVGETEKNIAELFEKARASQPTIIFFDEFEALGGDRTEGQPHERSAVAQLLTEMDGMDSKDQQILLLAATNEPWAIDPALRREGRFGRTLFISPPDQKAREKIFSLSLANRPVDKINLTELGKLTQGFSGADVKSVCEIATDIPLRESIRTGTKRKITMNDVKDGIKKTDSVLKQWFEKANQQIIKKNLENSFKELVDASRDLSENLV